MSDWIRCPFPIISVKQVWNGVSCIQILADGPQIGSHSIETQMDEYRHGYLLIFGFKKNVIYILNFNVISSRSLYSLSLQIIWIFFLVNSENLSCLQRDWIRSSKLLSGICIKIYT